MQIIKRLMLFLVLLVPAIAFASTTINPYGGHTAWTLHVMGNGTTLASVMESVKLVISPIGGGSFKYLLLFMGVTGFCILAIQAGFNPAANLFKMFSYILVVWVVTLTSTTLKANVDVMDHVTNQDTFVQDVPAIVAVPAALVSEVGHYLTVTMQTSFSTPDEFALTSGGYNIFNRITQDLDNFKLTNPELQRSMSAFTGDCVVPAIAQHRMSAADLLTSTNLWTTLSAASSDVVLTRYFYQQPTAAERASGVSAATGQPLGVSSENVSCSFAYNTITSELQAHARVLLDASASAWTHSGVVTPYETMMNLWIEKTSTGQVAGGGSYSTPQGLILQKSLANTMSGNFRDAAVSSGNSEVLLGLSIAQAEQSQKSGWITSAALFKNMMGYVYTTLQAFIFAIVPVMVVCLMIPGLGKKIFVNYGQILIWLTLWEPMLSIVNYLVTLFALDGAKSALAASGAVTMANSWVVSEGANTMQIAASFLMTSVPLLCWGLVNGAMAFTDFISHGIGSSFAMTAGAQAATGNVSLNSGQMNNFNSNKFDTASKSTVGNQSTVAFLNAGISEANNNLGGSTATTAAGQMSKKQSIGNSNSDGFTHANTTGSSKGTNDGDSYSRQLGRNQGNEDRVSKGHDESRDQSQSQSAAQGFVAAGAIAASLGTNANEGTTGNVVRANQENIAVSTKVSAGRKAGGAGGQAPGPAGAQALAGAPGTAGAAAGAGGAAPSASAAALPGHPAPGAQPGASKGGKGTAGLDMSGSAGNTTSNTASLASANSLGKSGSNNQTGTNTWTDGKTGTRASGESSKDSLGKSKSHSESGSNGESITRAKGQTGGVSMQESRAHTQSSSLTSSNSFDWASSVSQDDINWAMGYGDTPNNYAEQKQALDKFYAKAFSEYKAAGNAVEKAATSLGGAGKKDNAAFGQLPTNQNADFFSGYESVSGAPSYNSVKGGVDSMRNSSIESLKGVEKGTEVFGPRLQPATGSDGFAHSDKSSLHVEEALAVGGIGIIGFGIADKFLGKKGGVK